MSKEQWAAKLNLQFLGAFTVVLAAHPRTCWSKNTANEKENTQNATFKRAGMNSTGMAQGLQKGIARQEQIQQNLGQ